MEIGSSTSGSLQPGLCSNSPIFVDEDTRFPGAPITVPNTTFMRGPTSALRPERQQHFPSSGNGRRKKQYHLAEEYHVIPSPTGSLSDKENWDPETSTDIDTFKEAQPSGEDSPPSRPEIPSYMSCPEGSPSPPALSDITPRRFSDPASLGRKVVPLSPGVEIYRKERRPKHNRCPSYFDCDILPSLSPARASARATATSSEQANHQNGAPAASFAVGTSPDSSGWVHR